MLKTKTNILLFLSCIIVVLTVIASTVGLFSGTGKAQAFEHMNHYGDTVMIYGDGLYKNDSLLKAPISRGTDFAILLFAVPAFILTIINTTKKPEWKNQVTLTAFIGLFLYYSASLCFGVTYNGLFLVYMALFSITLYSFIIVISFLMQTDEQATVGNTEFVKAKSFYFFLVLCGIALFAAWLPDILSSLIYGRSLGLIEVYTTETTYVLDMAIIAPLAFIILFLLRKKSLLGWILLKTMIILCAFVGAMVGTQSVFQFIAGIEIPVAALITKAISFIMLALYAFLLNRKYNKMFREA